MQRIHQLAPAGGPKLKGKNLCSIAEGGNINLCVFNIYCEHIKYLSIFISSFMIFHLAKFLNKLFNRLEKVLLTHLQQSMLLTPLCIQIADLSALRDVITVDILPLPKVEAQGTSEAQGSGETFKRWCLSSELGDEKELASGRAEEGPRLTGHVLGMCEEQIQTQGKKAKEAHKWGGLR